MILEPLSQFVLARGLEDHADATTYYVRAVIRDAKTDELIDTVNLTDNGNRRFTKTWQVPPDPTGEGRDILITYTVYTDSGYTTKAENYGEKFDEHRVWHQTQHTGGGGMDIDYKKIRQMISEEIGNIPPPKPAEKTNLAPVLSAIAAVGEQISGIEIPKPQPVNLEPLASQIASQEQNLLQAINAKEVTPATELAPVIDAINALNSKLDAVEEQLRQVNLADATEATQGILERIKQFYGNDIEEVKAAVAQLDKRFGKIAYMTLLPNGQSINHNDE